MAAVILIPGSILWAAAQIRSFGYVVATAAPSIPIDWAIGGAALFTLLYTVFGGLLADVIHDLIQGITIAIGLIVVLVGVLVHLDAVGGIAPALGTVGPIALLPEGAGLSFWDIAEEWAIPVCGSVIATELVGRIIATRSPNVARRSSMMAGGLYIAIGTIPLVIGLLGQSVVPTLGEAEQVIPAVAHALLPTVFFAIFAGALVSAILSTVDSTLLVSSGLMSHNLLVPVFKVTDERTKVRIARAGVLAFGAMAYVQAIRANGVFELVESASAFGSAGTLVTVCFGLFTTLGGPIAAMLTLVTGMVSYLAASFAGHAYPFLLSLGLSVLTYVTTAAMERVMARVQSA
jgi:Na+/proline symporter